MTTPLVSEVDTLAKRVKMVGESVKVITDAFQDMVSHGGSAADELKMSAQSLSRCLLSSTESLQDCLRDVSAMGEAMSPVMTSSPEAAPALAINFYNALLRQLDNYFRETSSSFSSSTKLFEAAKTNFYKDPAAAGVGGATASSSSRAVSRPRSPVATPAEEADAPTEAATAPKKEKKKKPRHRDAAASAADDISETAAATDTPHDAPGDVVTRGGNAPTLSPSGDGDAEMQALAAAAAAGAGISGDAAQRKKKKRKAAADALPDDDPDAPNAAAAAQAGADAPPLPPPEREPTFLSVRTTVEDALGRAVLESRPNVFSPLEALTGKDAYASYYIALPKPGSLGFFICENYVNVPEDDLADMLCDLLDTDCVEMEPFAGAYGEVAVIPTNSNNYAYLPVCAWRQGVDEEQTHKLATVYMFARRPPGNDPTVFVHDSLTLNGARAEVVHAVSVLPQHAGYALVRVFVRAGALPAKAEALVNFTKAAFEAHGFQSVTETHVNSIIRRSRTAGALSSLDAHAADPNAGIFQSNMQMANLAEPQNTGSNLTLGTVAKGAMRGGLEVLKAPLTIGRTVTGAVLDVTGVSDAVRAGMESAFRKNFSQQCGSDTVIDAYNAAWQTGTIPNQGYLFVTQHWVCFCSTVNNATFAVEYEEIRDIQKAKSAKVFDNSIEIITHLGDHYFITSLLQRDQTFATLMKQWLQ